MIKGRHTASEGVIIGERSIFKFFLSVNDPSSVRVNASSCWITLSSSSSSPSSSRSHMICRCRYAIVSGGRGAASARYWSAYSARVYRNHPRSYSSPQSEPPSPPVDSPSDCMAVFFDPRPQAVAESPSTPRRTHCRSPLAPPVVLWEALSHFDCAASSLVFRSKQPSLLRMQVGVFVQSFTDAWVSAWRNEMETPLH